MAGQGREFWRLIRQAVTLPWTPIGRHRFWPGLWFHSWPLTSPLAALYRRTLVRRTRLAVVIGSFGKTTTTRAAAAVLGLPVDRVKGWNSRGLLARAVLTIRPGAAVALTEVGVKHKGRMVRYARLLKPDVVVVTSIGTEHYKTLGPISEIRAEKAEMVRRLSPAGLAVMNGDDPNVLWMRRQTQGRVVTFGFDGKNDVRAANYLSRGLSGGSFVLHAMGSSCTIRTRLVGRHMVYGLLAAVGVGLAEGLGLDCVVRAIESVPPTPHRLFPIQLPGGPGLLLDDYKSVYETVVVALETLADISATRRVVVLGEVFEPPGTEVEIYHALGKQLAHCADRVVLLGSETAYQSLCDGADGAGDTALTVVHHVRDGDVHNAAIVAGRGLTPDDVVLIKGLGTQRLERVGLLLAGQPVVCDRPSCKAPVTFDCAHCSHCCSRAH